MMSDEQIAEIANCLSPIPMRLTIRELEDAIDAKECVGVLPDGRTLIAKRLTVEQANRLLADRAELKAENEALREVAEAAKAMDAFLLEKSNALDFNIPDAVYLPWKKALAKFDALESKMKEKQS